jgi:hypothetical protein
VNYLAAYFPIYILTAANVSRNKNKTRKTFEKVFPELLTRDFLYFSGAKPVTDIHRYTRRRFREKGLKVPGNLSEKARFWPL